MAKNKDVMDVTSKKRNKRIEANIQRFQRMDPVSLMIELKLNKLAQEQYNECLEFLGSGLDRIKVERKLLQDELTEVVTQAA
jgi:hypothetical protein